MKIFVASWFYVPVTTSEALVTYKLLANSENEYVVCSAKSNKWSYKKDSELTSDNIRQIIIDTDDFDDYVEKTVETYKELTKAEKFDAVMTRSLPPESQYVGLKIREIEKDIPWIASLADPIGNNPYETTPFFMQSSRKIVRKLYYNLPHFFLKKVCPLVKRPLYKKMHDLYMLEQTVLQQADIIITPTEEQARYIMHEKELCDKKSLVVPHSYDKKLYKAAEKTDDRFTFTFIGQSDSFRSVLPIVYAVNVLKELNPELLNKIRIRLVGNIPAAVRDTAYVYFLQNVISIEDPCDYFESLKIMQESDCLIHIDAHFDILEHGSIFFAAKIADYLGAGKPILGITDKECPAGKIITAAGGVCCQSDPYFIAKSIVAIVNGNKTVNTAEAEKYSAEVVAAEFDKELRRRLSKDGK